MPVESRRIDTQVCDVAAHRRDHEVSILIRSGDAAGRWRGEEPRSKVSMMTMRPPQHGHGCAAGLRTTNPIESTFATVRHRTIRSKGCLSNRTALAMVFKLLEAAQKSWRRLDGTNQLPKLVLGVTFNDGIEVIAKPTDRQPTTAAA